MGSMRFVFQQAIRVARYVKLSMSSMILSYDANPSRMEFSEGTPPIALAATT